MPASKWPQVPLRDILAEPIRNGYSPVEDPEWTGIQMLGLGCLTPQGFEPRQLKNAPSSVPVNHAAVLRDGDLLVSRANTRELVGLAGTYRDVGVPCIYPDLVMRLRLKESYLPEFLELVLRNSSLRRRIKAIAQGTSESMVKISGAALASLLIPQVPLALQCRIMEFLNSATEAERVIRAAIEKLRTVRQGVLVSIIAPMAGAEVRGDVVWRHVQDVGEVRMGKQLSPSSRQFGTQLPYLRVANVLDGWIDYSDVKEMGFSDSERRAYRLLPGDVLLNEGQSLELVGRSAIYQRTEGEFYFQNTLVRFRPGEGLLPEYAQAVFSCWLATGVFAGIAKKTTSIAHLGGDRFAALPFPVIPVEEQQKIVALLSAWDEKIASEESALAKLRSLKQGLTGDLLSGKVRVPDVA